jgi:hypothetical protein
VDYKLTDLPQDKVISGSLNLPQVSKREPVARIPSYEGCHQVALTGSQLRCNTPKKVLGWGPKMNKGWHDYLLPALEF